jgi:hypothetical protein
MVAAWRWDRDDQYPRGLQMGRALLSAIREGPPWLAIDDLGHADQATPPRA